MPPAGVAAEIFPDRTIRIIVPQGAGGANDTVARILAQKLSETFKRPVVVDNRPGAATNLGTELVVRAAPDGHTVLLTNSTALANRTLFKNLAFDVRRDLAPVTALINTAFVLVVHPSLPARDVRELIALAKTRPGQLTYGSGGTAGPTHIAGVLLEQRTGIRLIHVPYKGGGQFITDVMAGQITMSFSGSSVALVHLPSGRLRALGVTAAKRIQAAKHIPTIAESGVPGYELIGWMGLFVPAATPAAIIARLNSETNKVLNAADIAKRFADLGLQGNGNTPAEFEAMVSREAEFYERIIRSAGIRLE